MTGKLFRMSGHERRREAENQEVREPRARYEDLYAYLIEGRTAGSLDEAQDDKLLEQLDDAWLAMSEPDRVAVDSRVPDGRPKYTLAEPFGEPIPEGYALEEDGGRTRAVAHGRRIAWFGAWRRGQRGPAKAVGDAWVHATCARRASSA